MQHLLLVLGVVVGCLLSQVDGKDIDIGICGFSHHHICFNDPEPLGCFDNGPKTPWCHLYTLPQDPKEFKPQFWIFTPEKGTASQTVSFFNLDPTLKALQFNPSRPFWAVVHGFGQDWPKSWIFPMVDALVAQGNNVLLVRWSKGAAAPDYFQAASNTRVMGAIVARILHRMMVLNSLDLSTSNLLGFSLGAHVVGFAGSQLPGLKRIVGLDPAGPLYASNDPLGTSPQTRLNNTDAKFVQCIHTDGSIIWDGGAGTTHQFGHVDFLANGGEIQPGCGAPIASAERDLLHFNWTYVFGDLKCNHVRAPFVFISSIVNSVHSSQCKYKAFPCANTADYNAGKCFSCGSQGCPIAGYELDWGTKFAGMFAFGTRGDNSTSGAFCGSQYLASVRADEKVAGEIRLTLVDGSNDLSESYLFQTSDETLYVKSIKVVVGNWGQTPVRVKVFYKRHTSVLFWKDGPKTFKLVQLSLLDQDGNTYQSEGPTQIDDGKEATVNLGVRSLKP